MAKEQNGTIFKTDRMKYMEYDTSKFTIWTWKHPLMLHWIINPGLAINELILGQRLPMVTLIEKGSSKAFIPCPHCGTLHSGLKWSYNAFKNWFGLYCDNCGKTIPCLTNLTSYSLLALTFPIWIWFRDKWKKNWLKKQPDRYKNLDLENAQNLPEGYGWMKIGLCWGLLMYIFMALVFPIIDGENLNPRKVLTSIPIWTIGGLVFGWYTTKEIMKKIVEKRK